MHSDFLKNCYQQKEVAVQIYRLFLSNQQYFLFKENKISL